MRPGALSIAAGGAAVAGALVGVVAERGLMARFFTSSGGDEAYGSLHGESVRVVADDGTSLYAEVDEPEDPRFADVTVVFSHGYSLNLDTWHYQRRDLRGRARLVFWDQRSHGRSQRGPQGSATIDQLGRDLAAVIAECAPTGRIVLVGHSMGGLVATRAVQVAGPDSAWVPLVTDVVTLGSPHEGAPLERVSNSALNGLIATSDVAAPIARLGHARSRGVKDLGPGLAEPLPSTIAHTAVVAAVGATTNTTVSTVLGDGIVPVSSAVGPAPQAAHVTVVEFTRSHHLSLLNHPGVTDLLGDIAARDDAGTGPAQVRAD